jgi:hypothetical protein
VNAQATPYQIQILQHTLGLSERRRDPYRNHFVAGERHSDMRHLEALEQAGLMERRRSPGFLADGDIVFAATDAGRDAAIAALPEPRKPTRYEEYLRADGCGGDSFGEFLCGSKLPEFESRQAPYGQKDGRWGYIGGDRYGNQYRMFRRAYAHAYDYHGYRDVEGEWCATKKDAKASYKAALEARDAAQRKII